MKFFFKHMLKVSAFYLEKQKSFIPKENIFLAVVNIKTKKLCLLTQFSGKVLGKSAYRLPTSSCHRSKYVNAPFGFYILSTKPNMYIYHLFCLAKIAIKE